jgi:hypothetical protein
MWLIRQERCATRRLSQQFRVLMVVVRTTNAIGEVEPLAVAGEVAVTSGAGGSSCSPPP